MEVGRSLYALRTAAGSEGPQTLAAAHAEIASLKAEVAHLTARVMRLEAR